MMLKDKRAFLKMELQPSRFGADSITLQRSSVVAGSWPSSAYSVEKLCRDIPPRVFRGLPNITRVTIVDPGPF
jgi:hypothetical protein